MNNIHDAEIRAGTIDHIIPEIRKIFKQNTDYAAARRAVNDYLNDEYEKNVKPIRQKIDETNHAVMDSIRHRQHRHESEAER